MTVFRWRDSGRLERALETAGGQDAFDAAVGAMLDDARGWRLAEMRKRRGLPQEQVAVRMGISVARVSQIESGDVSTQDVLMMAGHPTVRLVTRTAHSALAIPRSYRAGCCSAPRRANHAATDRL
jgi:DNA-binding XRE family transcriptional regulator